MRKCEVLLNGRAAGILTENGTGEYYFQYYDSYEGPPVSVTMPPEQRKYSFEEFPPQFENLLPEGTNLDMMLKAHQVDPDDLFSQLVAVGENTVGALTFREAKP